VERQGQDGEQGEGSGARNHGKLHPAEHPHNRGTPPSLPATAHAVQGEALREVDRDLDLDELRLNLNAQGE
jgi:hypothetical protein